MPPSVCRRERAHTGVAAGGWTDGSAVQVISRCGTGIIVLLVAGRTRRRSDRMTKEGEETDEGKCNEGEDYRGEDGA